MPQEPKKKLTWADLGAKGAPQSQPSAPAKKLTWDDLRSGQRVDPWAETPPATMLARQAKAAAIAPVQGLMQGVEGLSTGLSVAADKINDALGLNSDELRADFGSDAASPLKAVGKWSGKAARALAKAYPEGTEEGTVAATGRFVGAAAPQVAAALVAPESLLARLATGATANAFQTAGDEYLAAELGGADESQKMKAYVGGFGVGGGTGLVMQGILSRALSRPGASAVRELILSGGVGAGAGAAQQALSNVIAAHVAEYDPDRKLLEGVVQSGEAGGLGLALLSGLVRGYSARGARMKAEAQKVEQTRQTEAQRATEAQAAMAAEEAGQANLRKVEAEDRARYEAAQGEAREGAYMARRESEAEGMAAASEEYARTAEFEARSREEAARAEAEQRVLADRDETERMAATESEKLAAAQYRERERVESERATAAKADIDRQEAEFQARQAADLEQGRITREQAEVERVAEARRMEGERARQETEERTGYEARAATEAQRAASAQAEINARPKQGAARRKPKRGGKKEGAVDIGPAIDAVSNFVRRVGGRQPEGQKPLVPEDHPLARIARGAHDKLEPLTRVPSLKGEERSVRHAQARAINAATRAHNTIVVPMAEIMREAGVKVRPDFDPNASPENRQRFIAEPTLASYITAQDALERNPRIEAMDPTQKSGAGITTDEAKQIIANVKALPNAGAFYNALDKFYELTKLTRDTWRKTGTESLGLVDFLEQDAPHYAPAKTDVEGETGSGKRGRGYSIGIGHESRRALGRTTIPDDPVAFATRDLINALERGYANKAMNRVYAKFKANDGYGIAKVDPPTTRRYVRETKVGNKIVRGFDPSVADDPLVIAFKENGEPRFIEFDEKYKEFAASLKNADIEDVPPSLEWLVKAKNLLGKQLIAHNPIATPFLAAIDIAGGTIYNSAMHGEGVALGALRNLPYAFKALSDGTGPLAKSAMEWKGAGGEVGWLDARTLGDLQKKIDAELRATPNPVRRFLAAMERSRSVAEGQMRLATFHELRQRGASLSEAAEGSRKVALDWHKKGNWHGWMDGAYLFSGAGVKAGGQFVEILKATRTKQAARRAVGGLVAIGIAEGIVNSLNGGTDENGIPHWDKLTDYQKDAGLAFLLDGEQVGPKIPLQGPMRILPGIGWRMADVARNAMDPAVGMTLEEALASSLKLVVDSMDPFGTIHTDDGNATVVSHMPTVVKPIFEIQGNVVGHSGGKLYPEQYGDTLTPDAYRAFADTPEWAKKLAAEIGEGTGGQKEVEFRGKTLQHEKPGAIDWTPAAIEHVGRLLMSGALGEFYKASQQAGGGGVSTLPLVSRFTTRVSPHADARIFRENLRALEAGDLPATVDVDGTTYTLAALAKSKQKLIKKQEDDLKALPQDDPARAIKEARIKSLQMDFNKRVNEAKRAGARKAG